MLHKIRLKPGLDKQSSDTGAEGKWVNADYSRFRYSFPEKIGGWQQLVSDKLIGAGRDQHTWVDLAGNKYAAIGTDKCLYIYYEGAVYDITPLDTGRQQTSSTFTMVNTETTVTLTTSSAHGAEVGDIILLDSVTVPAGTGFSDSDFEDILFEVNDAFTRSTFVTAVEGFLSNLQARRGLEEYRVVADDSNNTATVLNNNQFVADIFVRPLNSINFIRLNFVSVRSGVEFSELAG